MPEPQTVVMKVGMHCEGCRKKVKKSLSKIPGIEELVVDLKGQKVTVRGNLDLQAVTSSITKMGKVVQVLSNTSNNNNNNSSKAKETPPPPAAPAPAAAPAPTKEALMKEYNQLAPPVLWIDAPQLQLLSDENPNACSVM